MFQVSDRLKNVKVSASAAMTRKVRDLRAEGVKIVGLSSGEPDFPTPLHAIEAAHKAALAGDTKYPPQDGVKPLKEAVRAKFKRDNKLDYTLDEVMVSNGSKQIMYDALMASVNTGDEVIIPALTFVATGNAVLQAGFKPVFVDVKRETLNIDVEKIEAVVTSRTRAIMPVSLYGQPCDMDEINAVAAAHFLPVIEDAAQAIGAKFKSWPAGSMSRSAK